MKRAPKKGTVAQPHPSAPPRRAPAILLVCAGLVAVNLFIYLQTRTHPFINFDDAQYVVENPNVSGGLSISSLRWAFTSPHAGNWHPVTWISHMLDVELFGLDAGKHHLVNVVLHTVNSLLLFVALLLMTGAVWRSAFVAALFAVHPTHVESVAWIAERKDVLSAWFWLLALIAYWRYTRTPSALRYGLLSLLFACGLMAKPMVVTLPLTLLLLDVWPLRRMKRESWRRLVLEKVPLFGMAIASGIVTFVVQRAAGAVKPLDVLPPARRLASAVLGYAEYVGKTIWPTDLALLYPHPPEVSWMAVTASAIALAGITVAAVWWGWRSGRGYLLTGWLWFVITLVPVIGLVQVGSQRMADRYTYVPTIGLFVVAAWGGAELIRRWRIPSFAVATVAIALTSANAVLARRQAARWESSISIWRHTVAVTRDNARAHNHLGHALAAAGQDDEAARQFERALELNPNSPEALNNYGALLARRGRPDAAAEAFARALELVPQLPHARDNLAMALTQAGRPQEAIVHFAELARERPSDAEVHRHLGVALAMSGRYTEAVSALQRAVDLAPNDARARNALGAALGSLGREDEALAQYQRAVQLDPRLFEARSNLGRTLLQTGRIDEGTSVLYALSIELLRAGQIRPALQEIELILRVDPDHPARELLTGLAARVRGEDGSRR